LRVLGKALIYNMTLPLDGKAQRLNE